MTVDSPAPIGPSLDVAAVQYDIAWEDKPANIDRVRTLLASSDVADGALVVVPEMFATGYTMNTALADEADDRPAERYLAELADRYGGALGGVVNRTGDRYRNEAVAFVGDREAARYAKMQPMAVAGEAEHFAAGESVVTFDFAAARICPLVCYDLRFPELFRQGVRLGAEIFIVIANFPAARATHWRSLLIARAIENQAAVVGVNRVGTDGNGLDYAGGSIVVDHYGNVLAEADATEQVLRARIDLGLLRKWRTEFPALDDMR